MQGQGPPERRRLPAPGAGAQLVDDAAAAARLVAPALLEGLAQYGSSCVTFTDPVWELDQAAFDLEWGAASFPLEDHVRFIFSDVPEPTSTLLLASALAALAVHRRRQR